MRHLFLLAWVMLLFIAAPAWAAKNVILLISDGAGFNCWRAASMYEGKWDAVKQRSTQIYEGPDWVQYACTTHPLNLSTRPTGKAEQDPAILYDPAKAWDASPLNRAGKGAFAGYRFVKQGATDSAAAGTAIATGVKTYNNAINWSDTNQPLTGRTIAEIAKARGRAVGVVSSVPWSHATPACLGGAHNPERNQYREIANEMLNAPYLDVIMGAGNPDFDDDGQPAQKKADYVGGPETWEQLKQGKHPKGWRLIQTKDEFEALAATPPQALIKVLGVPQVNSTLQQNRGKYRQTDTPFSQPLNANVPSLVTMTKAALNVLTRNPDGFFLMVEGGAVDWANHANQTARAIEEQVDFNQAIQAVVEWVEKHSSWNETLVICTSDHETGLIWGPQSDTVAFDPIVDRGPGKMPELRYHSSSHTNSVVPLVARGSGADQFAKLVRGVDAMAAKHWGFSGQLIDNTDIFKVLASAFGDPSAN